MLVGAILDRKRDERGPRAVVERFIRTLEEELIWLRDWDSADELRAAIATWLHHYLHHRPHQALNWQTPIERLAALAA